MRKILSGFLATAMVASVCATASFAATKAATITFNDPDFGNLANNENETSYDRLQLRATGENGSVTLAEASIQLEANRAGAAAGDPSTFNAADFGVALDGVKLNNIEIGGKIYQITLRHNDVTNKVVGTFSPAVKVSGLAGTGAEYTNYTLRLANSETETVWDLAASAISDGEGGETADIERNGTNLKAADVIVCDGQGYPVPLTENPRGVDKDLNGDDGVQSGSTVYFMIKDNEYKFGSDDYWKLKISKGDNGKYIKALSDVTKKFSGDMYNAINGQVVAGTGGERHRYIKAELNEIYTDDEIKISLDMRLTAKDAAVDRIGVEDDTEFKVNDFTFYMKNLVKAADGDWRVGVGGLMLNPVKNDWNEVTYYDEDGDLAYLKFFGDSDTGKFYAKLSTKWEHADYASYFNDQDAYIFQFTGSPNLSSTSRADLQIYSPFVDDDGNETFDPEQAVIYQVVDGDLFDITDSFTYEEGDNGDMAFCTRTRFLGTYIICQKPVDEASNDDVVDLVPDDLVPDDNTNAPVDVTPGNNGGSGSKAPANTGKF